MKKPTKILSLYWKYFTEFYLLIQKGFQKELASYLTVKITMVVVIETEDEGCISIRRSLELLPLTYVF